MKQLEAKNPVHIEHLEKSELKPEAYLQKFGEYILEIGNASKYGDKVNAGKVSRFTLVTPEEERE